MEEGSCYKVDSGSNHGVNWSCFRIEKVATLWGVNWLHPNKDAESCYIHQLLFWL